MNLKTGCTVVAALALLVLLVLLPNVVAFYMDWLWFQEVGFRQVFATVWSIRFEIWLGSFVVVYAFAYLNWYFTARRLPVMVRTLRLDPEGAQVIDIGKHSAHLGKPLAILMAVLLAQSAAAQYQTLLAYFHHGPFGQTDPLLGWDLSFYLFVLPFWEYLFQFLVWMVGGTLLLIAGLGWTRGALDLGPQGFSVSRQLRGHLTLLGMTLLLLLGAQSYLQIPNLNYSRRGPILGASYTDIQVVLPAIWILVGTFVLGAALLAANYFRKRRFLVPGTVLLCFAVQFVGTEVLPQVFQKFIVAPNELVKETPYIERNIQATRRAFGVDRVAERDLTGEGRLTAKDIENNAATLRSIRLWDRRPLLDTFAQIQEIRTYYDFISVDNDRYTINGEPQQLMLSPRELSTENLPDRRWLNEHLTYTHGFGLTMGPVNQVTSDGLPVLLVKDIPPVSSIDSIQVRRPEIYFGEKAEQYAFVGTTNREFNYPSGEENVYSTYEGKGGVPVAGLGRKAIMALHFRNLNIFTSPLITAGSRVLFHRNIRERVERIVPFLLLDRDPYLVVSQEGRLIWILDAYTVSGRYPYAQRFGNGINYIRNSVKVTVDAYDGTVRFYLIDTLDPLAQTYGQIFPGLFRPISEMPEDLQAHLRYPEDLFSLQTLVYSTYHMGQAQIFYNREDQWEIPRQAGGEEGMSPYYTIMKLPGEKKEEFILMLPFTPRGKDNLSSWIVGRCDRPNYGSLVAYRFPKQKLVFGPKQIENRISQDTVISQEVTLWDQRGSQVINGSLLVIPVEESLIYVRPLFIRAEGGKIPELKRVVVAYENRIVMAPTLDEALVLAFAESTETAAAPPASAGGSTAAPAVTSRAVTGAPSELAAQARQHYERAIEAQRQGNWALYGEEIRKLGEILQQLQPRKK